MSDAAITGYHAHIYYDPQTRETAELIRSEIERHFDVRMGRWRDEPVGPHPRSMFQVAFAPAQFAAIVPWLMLHRRELVVFLHPETGRPRDDHMLHAIWMGAMLPLDASALPETDADTATA